MKMIDKPAGRPHTHRLVNCCLLDVLHKKRAYKHLQQGTILFPTKSATPISFNVLARGVTLPTTSVSGLPSVKTVSSYVHSF